MLFFIIGIVLLIGGIIGLFYIYPKVAPAAVAALGIVAICVSLVSSVPTGYTGILTSFGKVEDRYIESGLNFKLPWHKIVLMDNREQTKEFSLSAFSSDIQNTLINCSVNFVLDPAKSVELYKSVGSNYFKVVMEPVLLEGVKNVVSRYTAEEMISVRADLSHMMFEEIESYFDKYGIRVTKFNLNDVDFSDEFTNAVEAKQIATQDSLRAETEQNRLTMEASAANKRREEEAETNAAVARIQAEAEAYEISIMAEAEANANKLIAASLTDEVLQRMYYEAWDGVLPRVTLNGAENFLPLIDVMGE